MPFYLRILLASALGILCAVIAGPRAASLAELGLVVVRLLKALATPLVFVSVIDAVARTGISRRQGARLLALSGANAIVATVIGLTIVNLTQAGRRWHGSLAGGVASAPARAGEGLTLDPLQNLSRLVPESLIEPFAKNNIIAIVLFAIAVGVALKTIARRAELGEAAQAMLRLVSAVQGVLSTLLGAIVQIMPLAVFAVVAGVVAKNGVQVFATLGVFLAVVLGGLAVQVGVYYSAVLALVARRSPRAFFAGALDALVTALTCGSSLATLPVTLACLEQKLGVRPAAARLAAMIGTNLNHDGIILYEATAALFVTQALGYDLSIGQQLAIALASVMAGIGIAGVPEAGFITLPLVLSAAELPEAVVATVVPLLLPIDWIIGRGRAATNVASDMVVAAVLDRYERDSTPT